MNLKIPATLIAIIIITHLIPGGYEDSAPWVVRDEDEDESDCGVEEDLTILIPELESEEECLISDKELDWSEEE